MLFECVVCFLAGGGWTLACLLFLADGGEGGLVCTIPSKKGFLARWVEVGVCLVMVCRRTRRLSARSQPMARDRREASRRGHLSPLGLFD